MTNPSKTYKNRPIFSNGDLTFMLEKADKIKDDYQRLRVKAVVALFKKFGKRRSEVSRLQLIDKDGNSDLKIENNYLYITWTISKKHKKGLFQYFNYVKNQIKLGKMPVNYLDFRQYSQLIIEHKEWQKSIDGFKIKEYVITKRISLEDKYCKFIIEYLNYIQANYPNIKYLFPSNIYSFGTLVSVIPDKHLSGSQLLRLIKALDPTAWCHLFRETKGAEIAQEYGNNLAGITQVKDTLDLEEEATAYRYTRRYAIQEIKAEV